MSPTHCVAGAIARYAAVLSSCKVHLRHSMPAVLGPTGGVLRPKDSTTLSELWVAQQFLVCHM